MAIPIIVKKNGELLKEFKSLQEVYRYFEKITALRNNDLFNPINFGIDDDKPWYYNGDIYEFETTAEHKEARASRITRNK